LDYQKTTDKVFIKHFLFNKSMKSKISSHNSNPSENSEPVAHSSLLGLLLAAVITIVLFNTYYGWYIGYPFVILGTWFHEMGHGMMSLILGGTLSHLEIFTNGSGLAHIGSLSPLSYSLSAAAGLMTPPLIGAIFILTGRSQKASKMMMFIFGFVLLLSVVIWVRTTFGVVAIGLWGATIIALAVQLPNSYKPFIIQLLGIQAWASTFRSIDYMFSNNAGELGKSDTQLIAETMGYMPYWFWGGMIAVYAILLLGVSLHIAFRK
jgi:hypothetical protein